MCDTFKHLYIGKTRQEVASNNARLDPCYFDLYFLQEESGSAEEQEKPEEKEAKGEKKKKHKKHKKHGSSKHKHKRSKHKKHKEKDKSPGVSAFCGRVDACVGGCSLEDSVNPRISASNKRVLRISAPPLV